MLSSNKYVLSPNLNMVNVKVSEEIWTTNQAPPEMNSTGQIQVDMLKNEQTAPS